MSIFRSAAEAAQILHEAGLPKKDAADFVEEIALLTAADRDRALFACADRIAQLIKERDAALRAVSAADRVSGAFAQLYAALHARDVTIGVLRMALRRAADLVAASMPAAATALRKTAGAT